MFFLEVEMNLVFLGVGVQKDRPEIHWRWQVPQEMSPNILTNKNGICLPCHYKCGDLKKTEQKCDHVREAQRLLQDVLVLHCSFIFKVNHLFSLPTTFMLV